MSQSILKFYPWPCFYGISRVHHMHSRIFKPPERSLRLFGIVHHSGDHHGRSAVIKEVYFLDQSFVLCDDVFQKVVYRPCHTVALGLSRNNHRIKIQEFPEELIALLADGLSLRTLDYLRTQHGIMFRKRPVALYVVIRLTVTGHRMKKNGFLDRGNKGMTDSPQHAMIRPDGEIILPSLTKLLRIVKKMS